VSRHIKSAAVVHDCPEVAMYRIGIEGTLGWALWGVELGASAQLGAIPLCQFRLKLLVARRHPGLKSMITGVVVGQVPILFNRTPL
jgi:hypothetical protein